MWSLAAFALLLAGPAALADGALVDSFQVVAPPGQTRVWATTSFGLLESDDDGATWQLLCEASGFGAYGSFLQVGAGPDDILAIISANGLSRSTDIGCSWSHPRNALSFTTDVFADPLNPQRFYVVGMGQVADGGSPYVITQSADGLTSLSPSFLLVAGAKESFTGVEVVRTAPDGGALDGGQLYATSAVLDDGGTQHPYLLYSTDEGAHWARTDLSALVGTYPVGILKVDPGTPGRLYLRVQAVNGEGYEQDVLAVLDHGDQSPVLTQHQALAARMSAFVLRQSGAVFVGTPLGGSVAGGAIQSADGVHYSPWPTAPHLRGLTERGGVLFGLGDNATDGYAVGRSTDGGTWEPLVAFSQLQALKQCVRAVCAADCPGVQQLVKFPASVCPEKPGADGGADAGTHPAPRPCGCTTGEPPALWGAGLAWVGLLVAARARRVRRR